MGGRLRIIADYPPNFDEISRVFDLSGREGGVIFCYGDAIYAPGTLKIEAPLFAHEGVHSSQQEREGGPEAWWRRYIDDPVFRVREEIEAYRAQLLDYGRIERDRNRRAQYLAHLARDLASPMYGSAIAYRDALKAIRA